VRLNAIRPADADHDGERSSPRSSSPTCRTMPSLTRTVHTRRGSPSRAAVTATAEPSGE
jgi:hypothetical protein